MSIWEIIPTCGDEMSVYTLCAFTIIIATWIMFTTVYTRYISNEFRRVEGWAKGEIDKISEKCASHDDYIDHTNGIINKIHIDLAVQESSMKDLKMDIAEIKRDIKTLLKRE